MRNSPVRPMTLPGSYFVLGADRLLRLSRVKFANRSIVCEGGVAIHRRVVHDAVLAECLAVNTSQGELHMSNPEIVILFTSPREIHEKGPVGFVTFLVRPRRIDAVIEHGLLKRPDINHDHYSIVVLH